MTLYLLFERLDAGKIRLDTQLKVSEHASEQAPTKLGLSPAKPSLSKTRSKRVVTKSANDAAVTIAENLGGDEDEFARLMTQKARALGMSRTTYVNASGLPDDDQVTTARDQALLGREIQERFPRYYKYFSTPEFVYRGREMRNHNHLLGVVGGVDGIKTGYTRASGFNLVTSVHRDGRYIVAVVLGGRSASERDAAHARTDQRPHQGGCRCCITSRRRSQKNPSRAPSHIQSLLTRAQTSPRAPSCSTDDHGHRDRSTASGFQRSDPAGHGQNDFLPHRAVANGFIRPMPALVPVAAAAPPAPAPVAVRTTPVMQPEPGTKPRSS